MGAMKNYAETKEMVQHKKYQQINVRHLPHYVWWCVVLSIVYHSTNSIHWTAENSIQMHFNERTAVIRLINCKNTREKNNSSYQSDVMYDMSHADKAL